MLKKILSSLLLVQAAYAETEASNTFINIKGKFTQFATNAMGVVVIADSALWKRDFNDTEWRMLLNSPISTLSTYSHLNDGELWIITKSNEIWATKNSCEKLDCWRRIENPHKFISLSVDHKNVWALDQVGRAYRCDHSCTFMMNCVPILNPYTFKTLSNGAQYIAIVENSTNQSYTCKKPCVSINDVRKLPELQNLSALSISKIDDSIMASRGAELHRLNNNQWNAIIAPSFNMIDNRNFRLMFGLTKEGHFYQGILSKPAPPSANASQQIPINPNQNQHSMQPQNQNTLQAQSYNQMSTIQSILNNQPSVANNPSFSNPTSAMPHQEHWPYSLYSNMHHQYPGDQSHFHP